MSNIHSSGLIHRYKMALFLAQNEGPVNLSGIQFDMDENISQAEHELAELSMTLHRLNKELRKALDAVQPRPGDVHVNVEDRNTDPEVKRIVGEMAEMSFGTDDLNRVASHPLVRLPVAYMASLAGYIIRDPYYSARWRNAVDEAESTYLGLGGEPLHG